VICRSRTSHASSDPCCWRIACRSAYKWTVYAGEHVHQWHLKSRRPSGLEQESKLTTQTCKLAYELIDRDEIPPPSEASVSFPLPFDASTSRVTKKTFLLHEIVEISESVPIIRFKVFYWTLLRTTTVFTCCIIRMLTQMDARIQRK